MRAICFIQEAKDSDLTMRQQQLICHRALRKLLWPASWSCSPRPVPRKQRSHCAPAWWTCCGLPRRARWTCWSSPTSRTCTAAAPNWTALLMSLLQYGVHTFGANNGQWIEPGGRHWMILPGYDFEE